jgi:hypothetical protein
LCGSVYKDVYAIEIDVTGSDYIVSCGVNSPYQGVGGYGFPGSKLNGTWSLTKYSETNDSAVWLTTFGLDFVSVTYSASVVFYFNKTEADPEIMTGAIAAPLLYAYKPQYRSSEFKTFDELYATAIASASVYAAGNSMPFGQYCNQFNKTALPQVTLGTLPAESNILGVPHIDTSDAFNRLVGTCNPTRVNVGSYRLGITGLRIYV